MNRTGTKLVLGLLFMLSAMNHTSQIQVESHLFNYFKYSFLKLGIFSISRLCIAVPPDEFGQACVVQLGLAQRSVL